MRGWKENNPVLVFDLCDIKDVYCSKAVLKGCVAWSFKEPPADRKEVFE